MRPFPPRTVSGNVPKVTPFFIGYRRGIDGNPVQLNQSRNATSVETIKCLRSMSQSTIPLVPIHERYQIAKAGFSKSALPPQKPFTVKVAEFKKQNTSTYTY